MNIQSEKEAKLHKRFEFWHESTTFTRYLMVFLMGVALYNFSLDERFYIFILALLANSVCYYSMKTTLEDIIEENNRNN